MIFLLLTLTFAQYHFGAVNTDSPSVLPTESPTDSPTGSPSDSPTESPTELVEVSLPVDVSLPAEVSLPAPTYNTTASPSEETVPDASDCSTMYDVSSCLSLFDTDACAKLVVGTELDLQECYICDEVDLQDCYKCNIADVASKCDPIEDFTIDGEVDSEGEVDEGAGETATLIKMLVLNLANNNDEDSGGWESRLMKIGDYIFENSVDLLFFSEVVFDGFGYNSMTVKTMENSAGNIVDYLREKYKMYCTIHANPAMYYYRDGNGSVLPTEDHSQFWEGLATISCNEKLYILTNEVILLDETYGSIDLNDRIAQYTRFEYDWKVFGCVNSHWSTDHEERSANVEETLMRLEEWKDISKFPNLIVGDLNAEIDVASPDPSLLVLQNDGWKDVWREKYPDKVTNPGYTVYDTQERRQDYIWANGPFYSGIGNIALVGRREHDYQDDYWSDHFGLLLTFDVHNFAEYTDTPTGMPVTPHPTYTLRPTPHPITQVVGNYTGITVEDAEENGISAEDAERHLAFDIIMLLLILFLACMLVPVIRWMWSTSSLNTTARKRSRMSAKYNQLENPEVEVGSPASPAAGSAIIGE